MRGQRASFPVAADVDHFSDVLRAAFFSFFGLPPDGMASKAGRRLLQALPSWFFCSLKSSRKITSDPARARLASRRHRQAGAAT